MTQHPSRIFLAVLIAFALSGSALILTLAAVFGPHAPGHATLSMVLGAVTAVLGVAVVLMRPLRRRPADQRS